MKIDQISSLFLCKDEEKLDESVKKYLISIRKEEYSIIQNQAPNIIGRKYNFLLAVLITFVIVVLNYDNLFPQQYAPTELITLENFEQLEKQVQHVFEHTIMKYSIVFPFKMKECKSYLPFIQSDTYCSQKSVQLITKLTYSIGFRPNYEKLTYNPNNNTIAGEWGTLEILGVTDEHNVQSQQNGLIHSWGLQQFQQKYQQVLRAVKPKMEQKVNEYIENITSSSTLLSIFEKNIKNSLMKIANDKRSPKEQFVNRLLTILNDGFDKVLIFLSIDPLFKDTVPPKEEFSTEKATLFYKQDIIIEEQIYQHKSDFQIKKQSDEKSIPKTHPQPKKVEQKQKITNKQKQNPKPQKPEDVYNSQEERAKYNKLLKKLR